MQTSQEPIVLFIMTLWIAIWLTFFLGGTRKNTLPKHPVLLRYSSLTFILIFVFYTILYTPTFSLGFIPTNTQLLTSIVFMVMGAYLMISARLAMKNITATEIFFSINPIYKTDGVFRHVTHPMYFGILMILIGSLSIYPSLQALIVLLGIGYCMHTKATLE